jgi:hypothetical protein
MPDPKEVACDVSHFLLLRLGRDRLKAACRKAARELKEYDAAHEREEQAEQEAVRAIYEERQRGGGPLTNDNKRPGDGWVWESRQHWVGHGFVFVEGWIPPRVDKWLDTPRGWPPQDPSFDTMVAALAAFHDVALPQVPPLLDDPEADAEDSSAWCLRRAFKTYLGVCEVAEAQIDAGGVHLALAYLDRVKAALRNQAPGRGAKTAAGGKPNDLMTIDKLKVALPDNFPSRTTLRRAVADGRLKDWRPRCKRGSKSPLLFSRVAFEAFRATLKAGR